MGSLLITFLLLGSFVGAALMIRYINTRTARGVPARARTRATVSVSARQDYSTRR